MVEYNVSITDNASVVSGATTLTAIMKVSWMVERIATNDQLIVIIWWICRLF